MEWLLLARELQIGRLVASGTDISSIDDLAKALEKTCPDIKIFTVDDADISEKAAKLGSTEGIKTFSGTLKVHQVTGCVFICLTLKSLSCFCDSELCHHFQLGTLDYPQTHRKFPLMLMIYTELVIQKLNLLR